MTDIARHFEVPPHAESIIAGIKNRRILIVVPHGECAEGTRDALESNSIPVQVMGADDRGLVVHHIQDHEGKPQLPCGIITILDLDTWRASLETNRTSRAADAVLHLGRTTQHGCTTDHILLVAETHDFPALFNIVIDRVTEADMVDQLGGPNRVPNALRRFMSWLPQRVEPESAFDSIFDDDAIARELNARSIIVCKDEMRHNDFPVLVAGLPTPGFDHRAVNQAFNHRRGRRR